MAEIAELLRRRSELDAQIAAHKKEMVAQVFAIMAQLGVTLEDLGVAVSIASAASTAAPPPRLGPKRAVKYRDENGNTWTGVGQRPRWLTARLLSGASLEDFKVKPS